VLVEDPSQYLYLYAQTMGNHTQYGLVGCAAVDEYWNDTIKKHELTRKDKEDDRCEHVRVTNAHSGPIFLTYKDDPAVDAIVKRIRESAPGTDIVADDGIRHRTWVIDRAEDISSLVAAFKKIPTLYIADGHHRSAAAGRVGRERQQQNPNHRGDEEYNFFLAVYFPGSQLKILDYNRVVKDLHGHKKEAFLAACQNWFDIKKVSAHYAPSAKGEIGIYLGKGEWYRAVAKPEAHKDADPVQRLDVSILQSLVLDPILGVKDPRTEKRIDFVGGIRGLGELERRVDSGEMAVAFSMFPTSVNELMNIADAGKIMPPKSTWFEPKLRDGLFVHFLD